jgi:hypothetical protein
MLYWWRRTWRPYAAAAIMALALWWCLPTTAVTHIADAFGRIGVAVLIAAPVYLLALLLLWHVSGRPAGLEQIAVDFLKRRLRPAPAR